MARQALRAGEVWGDNELVNGCAHGGLVNLGDVCVSLRLLPAAKRRNGLAHKGAQRAPDAPAPSARESLTDAEEEVKGESEVLQHVRYSDCDPDTIVYLNRAIAMLMVTDPEFSRQAAGRACNAFSMRMAQARAECSAE